MNMNMFNPEMMSQMKNMIDGKSMKNMLGNIANMSDDQIRMYLTASGMGHMSPQTFRQMAGQFKNMDESELERMKNMAPNTPPMGFPTNQTVYPANNNNTTNKTDAKPQKTNLSTSANDTNFSNGGTQPKSIVEKLEKIKIEGNNFFRQGKYKEASEKYYEILNEMEYISNSDKTNYDKQLEEMEIVCRLNIANTKIKQEDYDLVIHECLKVLKKSENYKAHYRAGVAFFKKGSHLKAYHHLTKAKEINKDADAEVERYLKECKKFVDDIEEDKKKSQTVVESKNENKKESENQTEKFTLNESNTFNENVKEEEKLSDESKKVEQEFNDEDIKFKNTPKTSYDNKNANNSESIKPSSKIEKLKEIVDKEVKTESVSNNKKQNDDVLIEENQEEIKTSSNTQQSKYYN
jgi:tetratricopeptide (TPR) repeat protein